MGIQTRLVSVAVVSMLMALGGCSDSSPASSSEESGSSGLPLCSDFANGEEITKDLTLGGCEDDEATSPGEVTSCGGGHQAVAVGPVYGFVGKPAHYLGEGVDASESSEWEKFKQDCPWDSE